MWECPGVKDLVIVFQSTGGEGFDQLALFAAPYVEGGYIVEVAVEASVLRAVRPEYREAFRPAR
jgi:hypothetical protein